MLAEDEVVVYAAVGEGFEADEGVGGWCSRGIMLVAGRGGRAGVEVVVGFVVRG